MVNSAEAYSPAHIVPTPSMSTCLFNMLHCFDVVGLVFLGYDMSKFLVCALCHVYVLLAMFMCLDLHVWMLCLVLLQLYISCLCLFLVFWL